jgi:hypothetical protein
MQLFFGRFLAFWLRYPGHPQSISFAVFVQACGERMANERTPQWQPLPALPLVARVIDGMWASTQENHLTLQAARHRPYTLDDYTVQRTQKVYREQVQYLPLYKQQLARWQQESLTAEQRHEIERLTNQ